MRKKQKAQAPSLTAKPQVNQISKQPEQLKMETSWSGPESQDSAIFKAQGISQIDCSLNSKSESEPFNSSFGAS